MVKLLTDLMVEHNLDLETLVSELKNYQGLTRKRTIADVVQAFPRLANIESHLEILADFGEDAAVLKVPGWVNNESVLLLAADGIMTSLLDADAYWAGYCSVLVNLHDIAAMGGEPLAIVDVLSIKDKSILAELTRGMNDACAKFGVHLVGGHLHPDSQYNAIDVTILGTARGNCVIFSHTAKTGDDIIVALDLDGKIHPNAKYAWDTTQHKSAEVVRKQLRIMSELGSSGLVHSGKDISNPGILGTLGMLLESSKKGAVVDLTTIPFPGKETIEFVHWLKMYQGCGFVVTCDPKNSQSVMDKYCSVGLEASIIGNISIEQKLVIKFEGNGKTLFDFEKEKITGL
jgi:putative methanogenesis marker protein 2